MKLITQKTKPVILVAFLVMSMLISGCLFSGTDIDGEGTVNISIAIPDEFSADKLLVNMINGEELNKEVLVEEQEVVAVQFTEVHSGPWEIIVKSDDNKWAAVKIISVAPGKETSVNLELEQLDTYILTVNQEGEGSITLTPDEDEYVDGANVSLEAVAEEGWEFIEWQGDVEGTDDTVTITMDSNKEVTAVFIEAIVMVHQEAEYDPEPWDVSTNQNHLPQTYGDSYAYSTDAGSMAKWTPEIPKNGEYGVYMWWSAHNTRDGAANVEIKHATGIDNVKINQTQNGGQWNYIGTYTLSEGADNYLGLSSSGNGQAIADAVRFVDAQYIGDEESVVIPELDPDLSSVTAVDNGDGSATFAMTIQTSDGEPVTGLSMNDIYLEWKPWGSRSLVVLDSGLDFGEDGSSSWYVPETEFAEITPGTYEWIMVRNPGKLPHEQTDGLECTVMGVIIESDIVTNDGVFRIEDTDNHYLN